ncbi:agamous-like MADS-box protein AGL80 [Diospyros lotus]|uniref:agamous-like MADS-box protein AGL80 n=1 Tax=Diospyros lotus TaxID=55363 RepID=UPI002259A6DC|nr:agamous-like MADS-box protein AGL80 [Diospyros lotus]
MAGKKVNLSLIPNEDERRSAYQAWKNDLMKEAEKLTASCGTEACAVILDPLSDEVDAVWPSNMGAQQVITRFKTTIELEQAKSKQNQESLTSKKVIDKVEEKLTEHVEENRAKEMHRTMSQCMVSREQVKQLGLEDLTEFISFLNTKIKEVEARRKAQGASLPQDMATTK